MYGADFKPVDSGYTSPSLYRTGRTPFGDIPDKFDFVADKRPVFAESVSGDMIEVPNRTAFYIEGTDTYLGQGSDKYQVVDHTEVLLKLFETVDENPALDTSDAHMLYAGRPEAMTASILFPSTSFKIGENDTHTLRINVTNAYNGSVSLQMLGGPWREWCSNGCYHIETIARYVHKHTKNLSPERMATKLEAAIDAFHTAPEVFAKLRDASVAITDARNFIKQTVARVPNPKNRGDYNKSLLDRIAANYDERLKRDSYMTMSAWDLYQALTAWASHDDNMREGTNPALAQHRREQSLIAATKKLHELVS